jgi:hypothetical protein
MQPSVRLCSRPGMGWLVAKGTGVRACVAARGGGDYRGGAVRCSAKPVAAMLAAESCGGKSNAGL